MFFLGIALKRLLAHTLTSALILSCAPSATADSRQVAQKVPSNGRVGADQTTSVEILTPTQGVDFKDYISRLVKIVKRNWHAIMPEAARNGEKGKVRVRFHIQQNGTLLIEEPKIESGSGKVPLDRAAVAAIRSSTPLSTCQTDSVAQISNCGLLSSTTFQSAAHTQTKIHFESEPKRIIRRSMESRILERFAPPFLYLVLLSFIVLACPTRGQEVSIEGTSLRVSLPPGWELGTPKVDSHGRTVFRYKGEQGFKIRVSQLTKWLEGLSTPMSLPFECDFYLGIFRKMPDGRIGSLVPRPDYFPEEFYSRVLSTQSLEHSGTPEVIACLFLGNSNLTAGLEPAPTEMQVPVLTKMLRAIVEAGKHQSTLLYAPGQIHLPVLNIAPSFSSGSWGVGQQKLPNLGDTDLLVRTGGSVEIKFTPTLTKGTCSDGMNAAALMKSLTALSATARIRRNPPYVSSKWQPAAFELPFPPETLDRPVINRLQVTTCRQLDASTELVVLIGYGSEEILQADAPTIATALDEIADAVLRGPKGDGAMYLPPLSIPAARSGNAIGGVIGGSSDQASTSSTASDLRIRIAGNIQEAQILKRVSPVYPPLARQTKVSGIVKLHVLIDKQGNIIELQAISGHPLLIQAAMDAVKQWQYKPTLLNGRPVLVDTEVNVIFDLKS